MNDQQNSDQNEFDPTNVPEEELKMPETYTETEEPHSQLSIVLGVLIVLLLLILGGLYLWGTTLSQPTPEPENTSRPTAAENNEPEANNAEADTAAMDAVSTSDEIEAIEADVEATNLDEIDAELNAIEAELDAATVE